MSQYGKLNEVASQLVSEHLISSAIPAEIVGEICIWFEKDFDVTVIDKRSVTSATHVSNGE